MKELNSCACVEVLEIVKYLDKSVKIDKEILEKIEKCKDKDYTFEINFDIPLFENDFMDETIELLNKLLVL